MFYFTILTIIHIYKKNEKKKTMKELKKNNNK